MLKTTPFVIREYKTSNDVSAIRLFQAHKDTTKTVTMTLKEMKKVMGKVKLSLSSMETALGW